MKKLFILLFLISFIALAGFSATLGIFTRTWSGSMGSSWSSGIYVESTAVGYPAYGKLIPGDIITEAVLMYGCPSSYNPCYSNPCQPCNPCQTNPCQTNPCQTNPCQTSPCQIQQPCTIPNAPLSLVASRELRDQLCAIESMGLCYRYKRIYNWRNMEYVLDVASPCATLVLRLYRTQQCTWVVVSIPLSSNPCPAPAPCYSTAPCQPCVTAVSPCNPCNCGVSTVVYSPAYPYTTYSVQIVVIP